jgi:excisionase family DNA binding protein
MSKNHKTTAEVEARLLTIRDVASLDQVCDKTVRRAIEQGRLAVIRVGPMGRLIRIHPSAHAAYRRAGVE